jgi:hypothetical protein
LKAQLYDIVLVGVHGLFFLFFIFFGALHWLARAAVIYGLMGFRVNDYTRQATLRRPMKT